MATSKGKKQTRLMNTWTLLCELFRGLPGRLLREREGKTFLETNDDGLAARSFHCAFRIKHAVDFITSAWQSDLPIVWTKQRNGD
jgi:hypothetical protein